MFVLAATNWPEAVQNVVGIIAGVAVVLGFFYFASKS